MRAPTEAEAKLASGGEVRDELTKVNLEHGTPPLELTAKVARFYAPFNASLARMLDDKGFLWDGSRGD